MICKRALEQKEWRMMNDYDVLIAGSGVAGLYAALNFAPEVRVLVLSKKERMLCNSALAQGGVAAVVDKENDDFRLHIADTLIAGGYKNNLRSLEILVNEGPEDVLRLLKEMHVDFDRDSEHHISMTLEGGHSRRRILHHKDSTGREITEKLLAAAMEKPNITFLDYAQLVNLVPGEGGFWAQLLIGDEPRVLSCSYCILCTGGIGRVYPYTTNSAIATGDGITLAHEMGARIRNLHLVQFHPTAFAAAQGRERFLISEAVRGEGATLLNKDGERFMYRYDERGELAPRDVVSRAIVREAARTGSEDMYLDIRFRGGEFIRNRFPMIYERCLAEGVDRGPHPSVPLPALPDGGDRCGGLRRYYGGPSVRGRGMLPYRGPRPQPAGEQFPAGSAGVRPPDDLRHQPPDAARGQRPHRGGARPADGGPALASRAPHRDPPDHAKGLVRPA